MKTNWIRFVVMLLLFAVVFVCASVTPVLADGSNPYPPICPGGPCTIMK